LAFSPGLLDRSRLNFEIDAHSFFPAFHPDQTRTLAQFRKADMRPLAQFEARGNQDAVDFQAGSPFEFKHDVDQARVTCTPAQHPTPTSEDCAGEGLHHPAPLVP
jgi:hypothetical protein